MANLTLEEHFKFTAVTWRNDHLEHCNPECNVSLYDLRRMAEAAGAKFKPEEAYRFESRNPVEFMPDGEYGQVVTVAPR